MAGSLYLGEGIVAYVGPGASATRHAHHAVQIACSFDDDEPVRILFDDGRVEGAAVVIPTGVPHRLETSARRLAIVFFDPLGTPGRALDRRARELLGEDAGALLTPVRPPAADDSADAGRFARQLADRLTGAAGRPDARELSPPVLAALAYVERTLDGGPVPADERRDARPTLIGAARAANLSPSRMTHVFSEQVGLPFKRYVQWSRLRRVVLAVADGASLTRAAADAGFSDSAHLSRTFRRAFGLPPSALLAMDVLPGWSGRV